MEKINTIPKMYKIDLNTIFFEIKLSMKGEKFRARSSSLAQIQNVKDIRPEATSSISYQNAIEKLIPKVENALNGTGKKLEKVYQNENGRLVYSVSNVIYENSTAVFGEHKVGKELATILANLFKNIIVSTDNTGSINDINIIDSTNSDNTTSSIIKKKKVTDVAIEWLQSLLKRTKKDTKDEDYLTPGTLEGYNKISRDWIFTYFEKNGEANDIRIFSEKTADEILKQTNSQSTKRLILITMRLLLEYAKDNNYITINPIKDKKLKKKKHVEQYDYDFIEEDDRALWINCIIEEIHRIKQKDSDAALAILCTLLQGDRPEETCGTKWKDFDFANNTYHIQNAYKKIPIYDEITMKRIGWEAKDGPLKTPESDRILSLDPLLKELLLEHRVRKMSQFAKEKKIWSEEEYVFTNTSGTPFTPDTLYKNFLRFIKRYKLKSMVLYGLRHSFATHCRTLGMPPEVLAKLMGHTTYETTQKYYIHISSKQKREELQKVQQKDLKNYASSNNGHVYLQNKVNKHIDNLQDIQKEDMEAYVKLLDDKALNTLSALIFNITAQRKLSIQK